jgi:peptidylprolyl isomerase
MPISRAVSGLRYLFITPFLFTSEFPFIRLLPMAASCSLRDSVPLFGVKQYLRSHLEVLMSQAKSGDTVKIHYTGTLDDGSQFDSSEGREPLGFTIGAGQVIPGFDEAVDGMKVGEKKTVRIESAKAYGERHPEMVQQVPKSALPADMEVEMGMPLQAQGPDGQFMNLVVTGISEDAIVVDGNHPLAGQALTFAIELVSIG